VREPLFDQTSESERGIARSRERPYRFLYFYLSGRARRTIDRSTDRSSISAAVTRSSDGPSKVVRGTRPRRKCASSRRRDLAESVLRRRSYLADGIIRSFLPWFSVTRHAKKRALLAHPHAWTIRVCSFFRTIHTRARARAHIHIHTHTQIRE